MVAWFQDALTILGSLNDQIGLKNFQASDRQVILTLNTYSGYSILTTLLFLETNTVLHSAWLS